ELEVGNRQVVVGKEGGATDALAIDPRAVGAAQVAQQEQSVCLDDHAVHLGDALVVQPKVAVLLAADERQVLDDLNRRTTVERNQLGAYDHSVVSDPGKSCRSAKVHLTRRDRSVATQNPINYNSLGRTRRSANLDSIPV